MPDIDYLLLVSRWLHIAAAITAVGGAMYARFAAAPSIKEQLDGPARTALQDAIRRRWAKFVHASIAVLLLTGSLNFVLLALPPKIKPLPYHPIFGVKFLLALAVFVIGTALVGRSPAFAKLRERNLHWLNVLLALAGIIVLISGLLSQVRIAQIGG